MAVLPEILALVAPSSDYDVLRKFNVPTDDGLKAAIAVTFESSKILQALYTLMLKMIAIQIWYLVVLIGISLSASPKKHRSHNISIANVIIWNAQASPLDIIKLMFAYITHISLYALLWTLLAGLAWVLSIALSLLVSPDLIIGLAAPVSGSSIYVPDYAGQPNVGSYSLRLNQISTPANVRAIGAADNLTTNANVNVGKPIVTDDGFKRPVYTIAYSYSVSDVDFGLQNSSGLLLTVNGSCFTDYTWYYQSLDSTDILEDIYTLFGTGNLTAVSTADGGPPLALFQRRRGEPTGPIGSNFSYAIIISSFKRKSYTPGTDPWYQTVPLLNDTSGAGYEVDRARPVLSCWQSDIWSYKGRNSSINDLESLRALPSALVLAFQHFLGIPRIINLGQSLGTTALKSAAGSQGHYFDAQTSNLHDDLQRLILGAYEATKNTLQETTRFSRQYPDITNLMLGTDGKLLPGADNFVIYTSNAAALSIPMLISVPLIALFLLCLNLLLTTSFPCYAMPWGHVHALRAAVIYSELDIETSKVAAAKTDPKDDPWDRTTPTPVYKTDRGGKTEGNQAHVRPAYNAKHRIWSWDGAAVAKGEGGTSGVMVGDVEQGTSK